MAVNILQSHATVMKIYNSSLLASAAQQGAGLVNAFEALTTTTIISPGELALNDTVRRAKSYQVRVTNIGDKVAEFKMSHKGAALATGAILWRRPAIEHPNIFSRFCGRLECPILSIMFEKSTWHNHNTYFLLWGLIWEICVVVSSSRKKMIAPGSNSVVRCASHILHRLTLWKLASSG